MKFPVRDQLPVQYFPSPDASKRCRFPPDRQGSGGGKRSDCHGLFKQIFPIDCQYLSTGSVRFFRQPRLDFGTELIQSKAFDFHSAAVGLEEIAVFRFAELEKTQEIDEVIRDFPAQDHTGQFAAGRHIDPDDIQLIACSSGAGRFRHSSFAGVKPR